LVADAPCAEQEWFLVMADGSDLAIAKRPLDQLKLDDFVFQRIAVGWSAPAASRGKGSWQAQ
jgi:hypothetical protein